MKPLLLGLLAALSVAACTDSGRSDADPPSASSAPPALALRASVPHATVYAGDPLRLRVQLTSPLDRQQAHLAAREREAGKTASLPSSRHVDQAPADWSGQLVLTLARVATDGRRETVVAPGPWSEWRITRADSKAAGALRIGDPFEEWHATPGAVQLVPGHYVLSAQWNGAADAAWPGAERSVQATEVAFEVRAADSAAQRAEHAQRQAQEDFRAGRYREARERAQETLRLDPAGALDPERVDTYLLIARSSLALGEAAVAVEAYQALLRRLPPPDASDLAVAVEQRLGLLSARLAEKSRPFSGAANRQ